MNINDKTASANNELILKIHHARSTRNTVTSSNMPPILQWLSGCLAMCGSGSITDLVTQGLA